MTAATVKNPFFDKLKLAHKNTSNAANDDFIVLTVKVPKNVHSALIKYFDKKYAHKTTLGKLILDEDEQKRDAGFNMCM